MRSTYGSGCSAQTFNCIRGSAKDRDTPCVEGLNFFSDSSCSTSTVNTRCSSGSCESGYCTNIKKIIGPCSSGDQCASGQCLNGNCRAEKVQGCSSCSAKKLAFSPYRYDVESGICSECSSGTLMKQSEYTDTQYGSSETFPLYGKWRFEKWTCVGADPSPPPPTPPTPASPPPEQTESADTSQNCKCSCCTGNYCSASIVASYDAESSTECGAADCRSRFSTLCPASGESGSVSSSYSETTTRTNGSASTSSDAKSIKVYASTFAAAGIHILMLAY